MASLKRKTTLSIIIPALNEASNLPLLFADLALWPYGIEVCVVDGGSTDNTKLVSKINGANTLEISEGNRGAQLHHGACNVLGEWILFLHADSRLHPKWVESVEQVISQPLLRSNSYFFDFKVKKSGIDFRLLESAVYFRSHFLKRPYGDQGLLLTKQTYNKAGGYLPLHLMEDLAFINRLKTISQLKGIGIPIYTDSRGWDKNNVLTKAFKNALLRYHWRKGVKSSKLKKLYYQNAPGK